LTQPIIGESDLPALFCAADYAAQRSQRMHIALTASNLGLLGLGALLDLAPGNIFSRVPCEVCAGVCFLLACLVTVLSSTLKLERKWYTARAVAESARTLAWKYMMRVRHRAARPDELSSDLHLTAELAAILEGYQEIGPMMGGKHGQGDQITPVMRLVREHGLEERRQIYLNQRVKTQRKWYADSSNRNSSRSTLVAVLVALAQLLALAAAGATLAGTQMKWSSAFAGAASSLIGWGKLRQYSELAESYGVAAQDLGLVEERGRGQLNEQEFWEFVEDSEAAISSVQIAWRARRVGK
jgi:hypothetical protein